MSDTARKQAYAVRPDAQPEPGRRELSHADAQQILDRQGEVLELIARAVPLPDVLTRLLTALERLMPGAQCSVLLLDRPRGTLHHGAAPTLPTAYVEAIDGLRIRDGAGSCGTAAALNLPVVAVDVRTDPRWVDFRAIAQDAGLRACWSTPIRGGDGMPVGTFAVYHPAPHEPSPREELLVDRFTHLASVAIEHAGLIGALVESEQRFRKSFDGNSLGMAIIAGDRTITTANPALAELVDLAGGGRALVGRRLPDLVTPRTGNLEELLRELDADDTATVVLDGALHRAGLPDVEVEVTVSRLPARDGAPTQDIVNILDLTERRVTEQHRRARLEAETARRTAEAHSTAKSELLAALGHEVRTPIQAIVGFAELLRTIELDEGRRREALGHIEGAARHVMDLLSDVLTISRLEAGVLPIALAPVAVDEVVTEVLGLLSATAGRRGVELRQSVDPVVVQADRRRLRQVLLNLVGNAIRHGGHRVEVRTTPADERVVRPADERGDQLAGLPAEGRATTAYAVLQVDDEGPGIPPDVLPRIFTAYARPTTTPRVSAGDTPTDLADESLGLGLGLAHGLMAAMGGELAVGHTSPAGTSMVLRIPRAPQASR